MSAPAFCYGSKYGLKHHKNVARLWRKFSISVEACREAEAKGEKACTKCGHFKPIPGNFSTNRTDFDPICNACRNKRLRAQYKGKARPKFIKATCGWCDREGHLIEAKAHGEPATFHPACYERFLAYESGKPVRDPVVEEGI